MARKSKPWAVVLLGPGVPEERTEHTGSTKAYEKVRAEVAAVKSGASRVSRIRVEQWEPAGGRWALFDDIDPKEW